MNILKNLTLIFLSLPILLSAQTSTLNTEMSKLKWTGKKITNSSHYGSLKFKSGEVMFSDGLIESGKFVVDMTTINVEDIQGNGKNRLEGHLRSDDFFSVDSFKEATLILKSSTKDGENLNVKGDIIICRSVSSIDNLIRWTKGLLNYKGRLILLKGGNVNKELKNIRSRFTIYNLDDIYSENYFKDKKIIEIHR